MSDRSPKAPPLTRRNALVGLSATLLHPKTANANPLSLRTAAARAGITFGASISAGMSPDYARLYIEEVAIATTDTALKFSALRPDSKNFRFAQADEILRFCQSHNIALRGHTLIWNEDLPAWLHAQSLAEIARSFDEHIEKTVSHFAGRLHSWDVVNEPFWPGHGLPGNYRNGPWYAALGPGYIARAFKRVHEIDKSVRLVLNEAHCQTQNGWGQGIRPALLRLVDELLNAGIPLHAVGLESHLVPQWGYDAAVYHRFMEDLARRPIEIYLTEMDVNDASFPDDIATRDQKVAQLYRTYLDSALKIPKVTLLETWQLSDAYSWYRDTDAAKVRAMRPLPFDAHLRAKPARDAILAALKSRRP